MFDELNEIFSLKTQILNGLYFEGCGALVFVIDAQDDYLDALAKLNMTVSRAHRANPDIKCEVFIHKVDGLSDDTKMETQRDIHQKG